MPIYAYRCSSCGHAQDALQKISDPVLTVCPACGAASYAKQVTAAGFQLKGSGWYVTDFRDGKGAGKEAAKGGAGDAGQAGAAPAAADGAKPAAPASEKAAAAPAAAATPAATAPATTPTKTGT